jgi:hypothetical protein
MAWSVRNLATDFGAPRALLGPAAYLFAAQSTKHVIYLGADDRGNSTGILYEGYCGADDVWHFKNLMNEAHGAPPAIASAAPTAYAFETEQTHMCCIGRATITSTSCIGMEAGTTTT